MLLNIYNKIKCIDKRIKYTLTFNKIHALCHYTSQNNVIPIDQLL
jgi:hypothetical protein